jgi:hypothetical protein
MTRSGWFLTGAIVFLWVPSVVFSWLLPLSTSSIGIKGIAKTPLFSSTEGFESESENEEEPAERTPEDFTGKTIYQRTFYRLSPDSQVQLPNSIMIEERLRFLPDTTRPGYILPVGPRTLILREGSEGQCEITTDCVFSVLFLNSVIKSLCTIREMLCFWMILNIPFLLSFRLEKMPFFRFVFLFFS